MNHKNIIRVKDSQTQRYNYISCSPIKTSKNSQVCMCSVTFNSLQPHGLKLARLLCPWNFPGKTPGVGCHAFLQGIFPTQESNPCLLCPLHYRQILYHLSHWHIFWFLFRLYKSFSFKNRSPTLKEQSEGDWLACCGIVVGYKSLRLPRWPSGKELTYQSRRRKRRRFSSWVGMIPWRRV